MLWCLSEGVEGRGRVGCDGGGGKGLLNLMKKSFSSFTLSVVTATALVFVLWPMMVLTPSQTSLMLFSLSFCLGCHIGARPFLRKPRRLVLGCMLKLKKLREPMRERG